MPATRLEPWTVSVAVAFAPEAVNCAEPSDVDPAVKLTVPLGAVVPLAGWTVTVSVVLADDRMLVGFALTAVVVAMGVGVTVTGTVPEEAPKPAAPP